MAGLEAPRTERVLERADQALDELMIMCDDLAAFVAALHLEATRRAIPAPRTEHDQ